MNSFRWAGSRAGRRRDVEEITTAGIGVGRVSHWSILLLFGYRPSLRAVPGAATVSQDFQKLVIDYSAGRTAVE